jgi:hypothetical protein
MTLTKKITQYIQTWAAALGISDYQYDFSLLSEKELKGDYARIDTDDESRDVTIEFNKHRLSKEPHEIEKTVVHELLHTRLNEYSEFVLDIIKTHITNPKTRTLLKRQVDKLEHKAIVAITEALLKERK